MSEQPSTAAAGQARRTVASFNTYAEAEAAVDYLSDKGFPVNRVAIIGHDLKLVEQVTGRLTWASAAWRGAVAGAVPGALIGWIFGLFAWIRPLVASLALAVYGLVFGAIVGAILGLIVYLAQRGRRDFASVQMMQPSRYDVVADAEVADEAVRLLQQRLGAPSRDPMSSAT
jgi:hypothetical protein